MHTHNQADKQVDVQATSKSYYKYYSDTSMKRLAQVQKRFKRNKTKALKKHSY